MVRCHIAKLERMRWDFEDADSLQLKCLRTSERRNATMLIVPAMDRLRLVVLAVFGNLSL